MGLRDNSQKNVVYLSYRQKFSKRPYVPSPQIAIPKCLERPLPPPKTRPVRHSRCIPH
jgi:hypothetical protein